MKKIKVFMFLFSILLLSGCSVEYDLALNDDLTVNEKVVAMGKVLKAADVEKLLHKLGF